MPKTKPDAYPTLGSFDYQEKPKLNFVPQWIERATLISCDIQTDKEKLDRFSDFLSKSILDRLHDRGITHLFPVQKLLIPELLAPFRSSILSSLPPRDICLSAPTGSGKTLSYVLPILEILRKSIDRSSPISIDDQNIDSSKSIHRIRALIVLPVIDLARQVYQVFRSFLDQDQDDGSQLKIVLLTGQQDLEIDIRNLYRKIDRNRMTADADIVVATPGRLLEHLNESGGAFSLKYLRFLVIDEADRLLSDYRIDWFKALEKSVYGNNSDQNQKKASWFFGEKRIENENSSISINRYRPNIGNIKALFDSGRYPLQKIFLSATLSYDPGQLQRLNLFRPKLFKAQQQKSAEIDRSINGDQSIDQPISDQSIADQSMDGGVVLPTELKEYYLTCSSNLKPLAIFCQLREHESDWKRILCFVHSRETSRRLSDLLSALGVADAKEASAGLTRIRRERLLKKLNGGKVRILICSDLLARGIDIAEVDCVINYDLPKNLLAYVHRAGRTARAGCSGTVVTIADETEISGFKNLMQSNKRWEKLTELQLPKESIKELKSKYRDALGQLKTVVHVQKRKCNKLRSRKRPRVKKSKEQQIETKKAKMT